MNLPTVSWILSCKAWSSLAEGGSPPTLLGAEEEEETWPALFSIKVSILGSEETMAAVDVLTYAVSFANVVGVEECATVEGVAGVGSSSVEESGVLWRDRERRSRAMALFFAPVPFLDGCEGMVAYAAESARSRHCVMS